MRERIEEARSAEFNFFRSFPGIKNRGLLLIPTKKTSKADRPDGLFLVRGLLVSQPRPTRIIDWPLNDAETNSDATNRRI